MIAFGPVPSRRLGHSLGVNIIPPKVCSYSCVYCQVGRTQNMKVSRSWFYEPKDILLAVENHVKKMRQGDGPVDYLTFVADGEPTLDGNLGNEIELLRSLGIDIAVITNASLMWRKNVREDLMKADWVSLKVDAANERTWRRINRPHETLRLNNILDGCLEFSKGYRGHLVTETMLVQGINDGDEELTEIGEFLSRLGPEKVYLSIPTRPPAENWAKAPSEACINRAYHILRDGIDQVEYLIGYEGDAFYSANGNIEDNLLSITSVHPMRESAVRRYLEQSGVDWSVVDRLISTDQLVETVYKGNKFYLRKPRTKNVR